MNQMTPRERTNGHARRHPSRPPGRGYDPQLELPGLTAAHPCPSGCGAKDVPVQMLAENGWELLALEILHGGDETMIEWGYVQPCPRCWRRPSKRKGCRKCQGWGYLGGGGHEEYAIWRFQTDTEINVVSEIEEGTDGFGDDD